MDSVFSYIKRQLQGKCKDDCIRAFTMMIGEYITGFEGSKLLITDATILTKNQIDSIKKYVSELGEDKPIQYVLGKTRFCGVELKVDERVLIPRPETEELVVWATEMGKKRVLDIGTGSGCIAIAMAKLTGSEVSAFDVSEEALEVARRNAADNEVKIDFKRVDILHPGVVDGTWNLIISNPPYITEKEMGEMERNVLDYEPHTALFVNDNNPLIFYSAIVDFAETHLVNGGWLFFEINQYLGDEVVKLLEGRRLKEVELRRDVFGNKRMIRAKKV